MIINHDTGPKLENLIVVLNLDLKFVSLVSVSARETSDRTHHYYLLHFSPESKDKLFFFINNLISLKNSQLFQFTHFNRVHKVRNVNDKLTKLKSIFKPIRMDNSESI